MFILYPLRDKLRLGIDLVGGTYLVLEVQTHEAVEAVLAEKMQLIVDKLKKSGKPLPKTREVKNEALTLTFATVDGLQNASSFLNMSEPQLRQTAAGTVLTIRLDEKEAKRVRDAAVAGNVDVLHLRLNKLNVEETPVSRQGEKNIIVELPGVDDPQKARAMIGKVAKLEFKIVERSAGSREDLLYELGGEELPPDKEILRGKEGEYFLVSRYTDITGKLLARS